MSVSSRTLLSILLFAIFPGCKKDVGKKKPDPGTTNNPLADSLDKIAPDNFKYTTSKNIQLNISVLSNSNTALKGILVNIAFPSPNLNEIIFKGITDENGKISGFLNVPHYIDTLIVDAKYIGLLRSAKAFIVNNSLNCTLGGKEGFSGNIAPNSNSLKTSSPKISGAGVSGATMSEILYMGSYDSYGRPLYREGTQDNISAQMLSDINSNLPEEKNIKNTHPQFISDQASSCLQIVSQSDVYATFISEGSEQLSALGFYSYPTANPPQSSSEISNIKYVFPNASLPMQGGNLKSGDKVKLGDFAAGTSIGFVLIPGAWNPSSKKVNNSKTMFYSNYNLNAESANLKRHHVLLNYKAENRFIIGFEDVERDNVKSDHDFNDVMFFVSSGNSNAISKEGVESLQSANDTDSDGVPDNIDQFSTDAARAFVNYFPSESSFGTIAFEDNWPSTGDYDLNDVVLNYRYVFVKNAKNDVVEMTGNFYVKAVGASYQNGFGVQFPFSPALISKVSGQKILNSYIELGATGLETGQSKAVIIPFDNTNALISNFAGAYFVNTKMNMPRVQGDTAHVNIKFVSPVSAATLGNAPFNPFLISNMRRGHEIHLAGYAPTDKADLKLLDTENDNSDTKTGRYYLSKDNWPWAISFIEPFDYPTEQSPITQAYPQFLKWTASGGNQFADWYNNTSSGYRENSFIYNK